MAKVTAEEESPGSRPQDMCLWAMSWRAHWGSPGTRSASHKLRSFLTLLGVIIGVASVIMVGAAIDGLGVYAEQSTAKAFGTESFMVAQIAATAASPPRVLRQDQAQQADPDRRRPLSGS